MYPEFDYTTERGILQVKVRNIRTVIHDRHVHCEVWVAGDPSWIPCAYSQEEFAPLIARIAF